MSETTGASSTGQRIEVPTAYYDHGDSDNVCFVCGDPHYHLFRRVTHYGFPFEFKRCQCGISPRWRFRRWSKQYLKDEPSRMATSRSRYRRMRESFAEQGQLDVMKIGPSTGTFLHVAQTARPPRARLRRLRAVRAVRRRALRREDRPRPLRAYRLRDGQFDRILLFNVIENVANQQEFLTAVHRTLKPGGLFILNFVDEQHNILSTLQKDKYVLYRPPICYTFAKPVMLRVLDKFGLEVVDDLADIRHMTLEKIVTPLGWPASWRSPPRSGSTTRRSRSTPTRHASSSPGDADRAAAERWPIGRRQSTELRMPATPPRTITGR